MVDGCCRCVHAKTHKEMPYAFNEPGLQNEVASYSLQDFFAEMDDPKVRVEGCAVSTREGGIRCKIEYVPYGNSRMRYPQRNGGNMTARRTDRRV